MSSCLVVGRIDGAGTAGVNRHKCDSSYDNLLGCLTVKWHAHSDKIL